MGNQFSLAEARDVKPPSKPTPLNLSSMERNLPKAQSKRSPGKHRPLSTKYQAKHKNYIIETKREEIHYDEQKYDNPLYRSRPIPPSPSSNSVNTVDSFASRGSSNSKCGHVGLKDFKVLKLLGKGYHGKVYLVRNIHDKQLYAMKQLRKKDVVSRKQVDNTMTEFRINCKLAEINHPFTARLHWAFNTKSRLYMVFDYLAGGELFYHIAQRGRLPEALARFYAAEIAYSLKKLHDQGIIYRDLKPENLLLDERGHLHLVDFGLSKENVHSKTKGSNSFCGTTEYLAPEILCNSGHGQAVDYWAMGMVLYELLTGLPPWYSHKKNEIVKGIMHGKLEFPNYISADAKSLIKGLLNRDPRKRLCGSDVLSHSFFDNVNWRKLSQRQISPGFVPPSDDLGSNFDPLFTNAKLEIEKSIENYSSRSDIFHEFYYEAPHPLNCDGSEDEDPIKFSSSRNGKQCSRTLRSGRDKRVVAAVAV